MHTYPYFLMTCAAALAVRLIVQFRKIQVIRQNPDGHDGERENLGSGFQVAAECLVRACQSNVRVQLSAHDVAVHAGDIGRTRGVLDSDTLYT